MNNQNCNSNRVYLWAEQLCKYAGEDSEYLNAFWEKLNASPGIMEEFIYYLDNGQFLGQYSIEGMTVLDIMIWQIDHFKSQLDRGLYDMQSNPDVMILKAFETMLEMEKNPEGYLGRYGQETGTDYPGKI